MSANLPVFLDARAICSRCGISISTLYRLCAKGVLPRPVHIGASSRWLESEVEAALAQMMEAR